MKKSVLKYPLIASFCIVFTLFLVVKSIPALHRFYMFSSGKIQEQYLNLNDFEAVDAEIIDDMTMINASDDTQLLYNGNIINMYVKCSFSYNPGVVELYYKSKDTAGFSTNKLLKAKINTDGYYTFTMPNNTKGIRFDTGIFSSIQINFEEIIINKYTFNDIYRFSTKDIFLVMIFSFLLYSLLLFIKEENKNYLNND